MTEVPGTDRDAAREHVLHETPLVPEDVDDTDDDPRTTGEPRNRGDEVKPPAGSTEFGAP